MLNNKTYDALKYCGLIACPAVATFIGTVGPLWGWSNVDAIVKTVNAIGILIGALVVVSNASYKANDGVNGDGTGKKNEDGNE